MRTMKDALESRLGTRVVTDLRVGDVLAIVSSIIEREEVGFGVWEKLSAREICGWGNVDEEGTMQTLQEDI